MLEIPERIYELCKFLDLNLVIDFGLGRLYCYDPATKFNKVAVFGITAWETGMYKLQIRIGNSL